MSEQNTNTVPPHLLNSGIDAEEPESDAATAPGKSSSSVKRGAKSGLSSLPAQGNKVLPLALGAVILFALGGGVGYVIANRNANPALATVNGAPIDKQQYAHRCEITIVNNAAVGPQVLRQMVMDELAIQYAAKQGVSPTDAQIDAKYQQISKSPSFADNLKKSLQTPEDVKHAIKANLAQTNVITKGITVSDQEIQNYYKANTDPSNRNARFYRPNAVQVAAVISTKEADIDNALHELASGVAFVEVAKKYSKDKSAVNGGLLPPIRRGDMNSQQFPGLENELFSLQPNQQRDKIKVGNTFWLVRCVARSQESTTPFDQVKAECEEGALLNKGARANGQSVQKDYQDFVKNADLKAPQAQYHDAVNINGKP